MKKAIILGQGGHAKVIHSFIKDLYHEVHFLKEGEDKILKEKTNTFTGVDFFIGVGDNLIREKLFKELKSLNLKLPTCIGPNSYIDKAAKLGEGVFIGAGAIIIAGATIGNNVIINTLSSVDHDCIVGDHSQLTAGIILGGTTRIGRNCFLGVKAATIPGIKIGDNVKVMAGSLVTKDVPNDLMVGGYPAKVIKSIVQE